MSFYKSQLDSPITWDVSRGWWNVGRSLATRERSADSRLLEDAICLYQGTYGVDFDEASLVGGWDHQLSLMKRGNSPQSVSVGLAA